MILKFRKGFSLVELLVVIAIIGILAAVGITAYQGYTTGAKEKAVLANQKQIVSLINAEMAKCAGGTGTYPWGLYNVGTGKWDALSKCDRTSTPGNDPADFVEGHVSAEAIVAYIDHNLQLKNPWDNTDTTIGLEEAWVGDATDVGKILILCGTATKKNCTVQSTINKTPTTSTVVTIAYY